ncbi:MAG: exosortase F system-associated protein [Weeksellaceae bacterium]|nr:exosortase F system-associated protein [Weeksellaceae bacterium]
MLRWILLLVGIMALIGIRGLEDQIFYDPFLGYFKSADHSAVFPDYKWGKLILGYIFRFFLNAFLSLWIVHLLFQNWKWTKQAFALIALIFLIVFPIYLLCIRDHFQFGYLFSFYIRRFVIQPLPLLLIIPIFYYRKRLSVR